MTELMRLFLLLWGLVGSDYEWRDVRPDDISTLPVVAQGGFNCEAGVGWLRTNASLEVVVHELAHAYDCSDDGLLNGSPGHPPGIDWSKVCAARGYECPYWRAEWYAYRVVHTLSLE